MQIPGFQKATQELSHLPYLPAIYPPQSIPQQVKAEDGEGVEVTESQESGEEEEAEDEEGEDDESHECDESHE